MARRGKAPMERRAEAASSLSQKNCHTIAAWGTSDMWEAESVPMASQPRSCADALEAPSATNTKTATRWSTQERG